jgi:hybrid cluster-associated redox disulfide protein
MQYFKSSQPVPGKGFAWTYYECDDDRTIQRYLTVTPETAEVKRVADPIVRDLYDNMSLMATSEEEFKRYWPDSLDVEAEGTGAAAPASGPAGMRYFNMDMTIQEAMSLHPRVPEVMAAFHLGGCASCGISSFETLAQVCMAYGVDIDTMLEVLESLMQPSESSAT